MDVREVRQRVADAIGERGLGSPTLLGETVLIQRGYYAGRRFIFADVEAVWRAGAGEVLLSTHEGESLPPISLAAAGGAASQCPAA